ncbi:uncharacterized protein [Malus domestica]|uniref:uncharacterized protein n=1 Tax=Malus domestica TaxID=3750 RepID=UPI003976DDA3
MERYYKKQCLDPPSNILGSPYPSNIPSNLPPSSNIPSSSQQSDATELDEILANLPTDPGHRCQMLDYPPNYHEAIHSNKRCFITGWFDKFKWLEYNISKDAAFCHYCYLFKCDFDQMGSTESDIFIEKSEKVRKVVFKNALKNVKYTSSDIQNDLVHDCTIETINQISKYMEGTFFALLVDGSRDALTKEQMAMVLRYVNKKGEAIEKFLGVQHVSSTTSSSLEKVIERLFATTNLSMSTLQGQGYDGASNMRALVFVAKENEDVANFLINASSLVNLIGSLCKRREAFREKQQEQIKKALDLGNLETATRLLRRKHCKRVILGITNELAQAFDRNQDIQTFDFAFHLFLMRLILGITNELAQALQKKYQDIVNAMALVEVCKQRLQSLKDDDFGDLFHDVEKFCEEHDIIVPNMEDLHFVPRKLRRKAPIITNFHYYRVDLYFQVLDMQLRELNDCFTEVNTKLLLCMACLSLVNKFASSNKAKIVHLAQLYPQDFDHIDLMNLLIQLDNYIHDMKMHSKFSSFRGISDLAKELVKTRMCESYMLVYKLLTLPLVLLVATASVKKAFSTMKIVKTPLRNKMGDQWLSDSIVVYIERDVFAFIDNKTIIRRFHDMKPRRQQL